MLSAAARMMCLPLSVLPVTETILTFGWLESACATPGPLVIILSTPGARPASSAISPNLTVLTGVLRPLPGFPVPRHALHEVSQTSAHRHTLHGPPRRHDLHLLSNLKAPGQWARLLRGQYRQQSCPNYF